MAVNVSVIQGNLCANVETRQISGGSTVADLRLAHNRRYGDKEETVFVDVTAWNQTAEFAARYLHRGSGVIVTGELRMDQWEDRETGKRRSKVYINANKIDFAGRKGDDEGGGETRRQDRPAPVTPARPAEEPAEPVGETGADDQEIPF